MSNIKRKNVLIISAILVVVAITLITYIYVNNEIVVGSSGTLYELVTKEKFFTESPIVAKVTSIQAIEKSIQIESKSIPVKEYTLVVNDVYKGELQDNQQIIMQDDRYKNSKK